MVGEERCELADQLFSGKPLLKSKSEYQKEQLRGSSDLLYRVVEPKTFRQHLLEQFAKRTSANSLASSLLQRIAWYCVSCKQRCRKCMLRG